MPDPTRAAKLPNQPEEMICFAVYAASHAINRAYAPLLKPLGLTYPQYITLTFLWHQDGMSVGELSRRLQMETSTLTPLLKRLEKLGHLERRRGVDDERKVFVHLTKRGWAVQKTAPDITACLIEATGMDLNTLEGMVADLRHLRRQLIEEKT